MLSSIAIYTAASLHLNILALQCSQGASSTTSLTRLWLSSLSKAPITWTSCSATPTIRHQYERRDNWRPLTS